MSTTTPTTAERWAKDAERHAAEAERHAAEAYRRAHDATDQTADPAEAHDAMRDAQLAEVGARRAACEADTLALGCADLADDMPSRAHAMAAGWAAARAVAMSELATKWSDHATVNRHR